MKMMKRTLLTWCLLGLLCPAMAQQADNATALVVTLADGSKQTFLLQENPVITLDGQLLRVKSASLETDFERAGVDDFHFETLSTGIDTPEQQELRFVVTGNGKLSIFGLDGGEEGRIAVYDAQGRACKAHTRRQGDGVTVSLASLQRGVYVINIGKRQSIKISKQ